MPEATSSKSSSSRSHRSSRHHQRSSVIEKYLAGVLLLVVLLASGLAEMPWIPNPWPVRILQGTLLGALFIVIAVATFQERFQTMLLRGPTPWMLALTAWHFYGILNAPDSKWALARCLLILIGLSVYIIAGFGLKSDTIRWVATAAIGIGVAQSLLGFAQFGQDQSASRGAIFASFGNHESLGSFLLILIPPAIALALQPRLEFKTRLYSQAAAVVLVGALLIARTRSAWIGLVAGAIMMAVLAAKEGHIRIDRNRKHDLVGPAAVVAAGLIVFVIIGELMPLLGERATTFQFLKDDTSFIDRLNQWRGAVLATAERPFTGWGTGSWPIVQSWWTHTADEPFTVTRVGTGHSNLAHNVWVQTAAELGVTGLALYAGLFISLMHSVIQRLPEMSERNHHHRKALAMGAVCAVFASIVDGLGSPAHVFPGVLIQLWFWMGVGVGACREHEVAPEALLPVKPTMHITTGVIAAVIGCIPLAFAFRLNQGQARIKPPTVEIVAQTIKRPDGKQGVQAIAVVTNPDGKDRTSAPGIEWSATGLTNVSQSAIDVDGGGVRSVLTGIPQPGAQPVFFAKWRDETGRIITTHNP
jgi:O-antigen ligase